MLDPNSQQSSTLLWIDDCDPRVDPDICREARSFETLRDFHETVASLPATLDYSVPESAADLAQYDGVIANFCGPAMTSEEVQQLLRRFVRSGGSAIVLGDNFCVAGQSEDRLTSAAAATRITAEWGITFTDRMGDSGHSDIILAHQITSGVTDVYVHGNAYLRVETPARALVHLVGGPVIAVSDEARVLAIADVGFHWSGDEEAAFSDNLKLWRNALEWMTDR